MTPTANTIGRLMSAIPESIWFFLVILVVIALALAFSFLIYRLHQQDLKRARWHEQDAIHRAARDWERAKGRY